ncbi:membrane-bound lytic murein transglycosylase B [Streptomyces sp. CG 926]|uniref:lytic transglycosylase domain-containing protein n=1 Tax=Streptomyces sp. CG 926 TaxID=1882405 RepID=UPI000D6D7899|nr:lytic transglycosylase domain-containing protein [Streptomyces sp. CG 926]PWK73093.1 membrane-bound lytic murein transglycosylase B [Streptomyces sp. CG 926]
MKPLHRHLVNTSRKVLCTAALAASLTTAAVVSSPSTADAGESEPTPDSPQAADRGDARLELPDIVADPPPTGVGAPEGAGGIPATALDAYHRAEVSVAAALPNCKLPWQLLAGIGRVESVHASGYGLKADGYTEKPIRGPRLDGNGFAEIRDTDKGEWDADAVYDRAVGPMQFIPSTWAKWGADGNGDAKRDPNNIYDAALGAGLYLCAGDRDLSNEAKLDQAILSYNNSREYVNTVLGYMRQYQNGVGAVENPPVGNYPTQPPGTLPTPHVPLTPSNPVTPTPTPTPKPTPTPAPTPTPTPTPEQPKPATPHLAGLTVLDGPGLTAEAGAAFAEVPRVKVLLSDGKPAVGQEVVFAVEKDTTGGTLFGTADSLVVKAGADGIAAAPGLKAGPKAGTFTLRASAYDPQGGLTVNFDGKVTVTVADKLARADGAKAPETVAGKSFTGVEVFATAAGKPVAGTETVAELVVKGADGTWAPVDPETAKAPFFKDEAGKPVFGRVPAKSAADGKIVLPELFTTDVAPGSYFVRLTTKEKVTFVLELKVTAPATTPTTPTTPTAPTTDPVPAKDPARP